LRPSRRSDWSTILSESSPSTEAWTAAARGFGAAVEQYYTSRGADPSADNVKVTVRTNTELVPRRADVLASLLAALAPGATFEGSRILESGCGFGALGGYLAWRYASAEVIAIDVREDYVLGATESAKALDVGSGLRYQVDDMRACETVADDWANVVIVNNAFIYLPTAQDMRRALESLARVTAHGGVVLLYHANKWAWREPFTHDPLVHLLPPRLAQRVSKMTGWKHNHGRVRLLSPLEMKRRLRRAGFDQVRVGHYDSGEAKLDRAAYLSRFYAAAGRRP
jgi:SAM-dependent methyltransferase